MFRKQSFLWGMVSYILLWWLLSLVTANQSLPSPVATFIRFGELLDEIFLHTGASLARILVALALSLVIGVPLGMVMGQSSIVNQWLGPLMYFLYPIPKVAFLPVFMIFFGLGNVSKVILIISVISIQVVISIRDAVVEIPAAYTQVMDNYGPTAWQRIRYLILPAILPRLFASLRVSIGIALASLFFAENYNTRYGIGYLILSAWSKMDYEQMMVGILFIAILGYLLFSVLDGMERRLTPYK